MKVLVADNDRQLGPVLVDALASGEIDADLVASGREAIDRATVIDYAAIVTEVTLPDVDGFHVCRAIRKERVPAPILILSKRCSIEDRIQGLESGADDYVAKPFSLRELLARVRAISRRGPLRQGMVLHSGDLYLDPSRHQARRGESAIDLSRREFLVLEALMRDPGRVLSRDQLLEQAWSDSHGVRSNVVEVYMRYLREKIDRPFGRASLQTVRGVGYRLCGDA